MKSYEIAPLLAGKTIEHADLYSTGTTLYFTDGTKLTLEAAHGYSDEPGYYGGDPFPELRFNFSPTGDRR